MTKRWVAVVFAAVAGVVAVSAVVYFGVRGRFTSPPPPEQIRPDLADHIKPDAAPDDPSAYRPAPVSLSAASAFLYTGKTPRQVGMDPTALRRRCAAVIRGQVRATDGKPLAGVEVGAPGQPEVGRTFTDSDGGFDLAVNGGAPVLVAYQKAGFLPARRWVATPWQDYAWAPDVVLTPPGGRIGALDFPANGARALPGPRVEDAAGARRPVFVAPAGFGATEVFSDGDKPLNRLALSAVEFDVGGHGAAALPVLPPPGAASCYAIDLGTDEPLDPGGLEVKFNKPLLQYVENFPNLPAGTVLPLAHFDGERSLWLPSPPGRVVRVVGVKDGLVELDVDGKGRAADAATLAKLGVSEVERRRLVEVYGKDGAALWRLPLTGLGAWAVLPALRPPDDAVAPPWPVAAAPALEATAPRPAAETVSLSGTHYRLCYDGALAPGFKAPYTLEAMLRGPDMPQSVKRIDLEIRIAGRRFLFTDEHEPKRTFIWDGLDAYGRPVQGRRPALVRVGYVYDAAPPARQECVLWREQRVMLGDWDARAAGLGGWTLTIHHCYDPIGRVLHLGDGGRREGTKLPPVVTTVAGGTGSLTFNDDDQPAFWANLSRPRGLAAGPDGGLYIADAGQNRVRRVTPDGLIATVAGNGRRGYDGDNHAAVEAELNAPTGLAFGPDGSLYIADDGNDRVRRLRPDGALAAFAGRGGRLEYSGDGGPAVVAQLSLLGGLAVGPGGNLFIAQNSFYQCVRRVTPDGVVTRFVGGPPLPSPLGGEGREADLRTACAVAVDPDGVLYVADGDGCRVWRVGPNGRATVFAGTGKAGFSGDDGPADKAELNTPSGLAVGPDGGVYIADAGNQRVRRVGPDGVIRTVAGKGKTAPEGDVGDYGPATKASLRLMERPEPGVGRLVGLAVGPDGSLYVSDVGHGSVRRVAPAFDGISDSEILLTSENGAELYVFDGVGRHLKTLDAATGATLYRFVYDAAWRLTEIHDGSGAVTKIERDRAGRPRAVVAPDGERTKLETGPDGRLNRIVFPSGEGTDMEYDAGGLLTSYKDATGKVARFRYDEMGRLVKE